ncbi:hypothetical protein B0H10DRAFT_2039108 [Mycena sp. CBHHK59/15]|nr:hypothetical protein B0H10DRAFT_2039108 [Mycena sp. CBHHK59/15]
MAVIAAAHSSISDVIRNKCIDLVHYVLAKDCDRPTDELREKATALEATVFERFTDSELYKSRMRLAFVNLSDKNLQKFKNAVIDGVVHVNECLKSKGDLEGLEAILSAGTKLQIRVVVSNDFQPSVRIRCTHQIARLRKAVHRACPLRFGATGTLLLLQNGHWRILYDEHTPHDVKMKDGDTVYAGGICFVHDGPRTYKMFVRRDSTFSHMRPLLLKRPHVNAGFSLEFGGRVIDMAGTPESLNMGDSTHLTLEYPPWPHHTENILGPQHLKPGSFETDAYEWESCKSEPCEPDEPSAQKHRPAKFWTYVEVTPPPGSVQQVYHFEKRLRTRR